MSELLDWFNSHQSVLTWLGVASVATFIVSLISLPWLVGRIPENYFLHDHREPSSWKESHPMVRFSLITIKNLLGFILLAGGFLMLFLPGQGLLTMAMGLLLMDYPGKYKLERRLAARPAILHSLNWLREKAKKPPLKIS